MKVNKIQAVNMNMHS